MRHVAIFFILITYLSNGICPLYSIIQQNESIQSELPSTYEIFPNGHSICAIHNTDGNPIHISIPGIAEIMYEYLDGKTSKIHRLDNSGRVMYTHTYLPNGKEIMIGDLGIIEKSLDDLTYTCKTPYSFEVCKYNETGNILQRVIDDEVISYEYDKHNRLLYESDNFQDKLEVHHGFPLVYDKQGNLIQKKNIQYTYDKRKQINRNCH